MSEKIIITLWRGDFKLQQESFGIYCLINYGSQQRKSKTIHNIKQLLWKETYIFNLDKIKSELKLQFISLNQTEKIHYTKDNVTESISFGKCILPISITNTNKGTIPRKVQVSNNNGVVIGKVFLQYQILKSEVKYLVQKQLDYNYMVIISEIKVSFTRNLKKTPELYLKASIGDSKTRLEEFPFEYQNSKYIYHYPIKYYIKNEHQLTLQLISNSRADVSQKKKIGNKTSTKGSISTENQNTGKNPKKMISVENSKIFSIIDLNFIGNKLSQQKLPLYMPIRREIGTMQFQLQILYKSNDKQKQQLDTKVKQVNKKQSNKKEKKKFTKIKNGNIVVNSIIAKLEPVNQQAMVDKDFSIQLKIGKQCLLSSRLERPGLELIFIQSFKFKRTWQQKMQFSVMVYQNKDAKAIFFTSLNLKELFQLGNLSAKHIPLTDENQNYSGEIIIDISYIEIQQKKKQQPKTIEIKSQQKFSPQEVQDRQRLMKIQQIKKRMKQRQEKRDKNINYHNKSKQFNLHYIQSSVDVSLPSVPQYHSPGQKSRYIKHPRYNIYNKNHNIIFSQSPRFKQTTQKSHESFLIKRSSMLDEIKGGFIGYNKKISISRNQEVFPGVGRYYLPSLWDKYNN